MMGNTDRREVMKGLLAAAIVIAAGASPAIVMPSDEAISRWANKWLDQYVTIGSEGTKEEILITFNFDGKRLESDLRAALFAGEIV